MLTTSFGPSFFFAGSAPARAVPADGESRTQEAREQPASPRIMDEYREALEDMKQVLRRGC